MAGLWLRESDSRDNLGRNPSILSLDGYIVPVSHVFIPWPSACPLQKPWIIYVMHHNPVVIAMRNTSDLVNEMLAEAKTAWLLAIVVGFEKDTKFVFSTSKQPLEELNRLVQDGGSPVGLLKFEKTGDTITGKYRPFEEYENIQWAGEYLAGLLENTGAIIALSGQQG
jgi:hypothetical protein